jgi:hypothetical protein
MHPKKIKMLMCFLNIRDIEFVPEGTTVNETFCVELLKRSIDAVRCKKQSFGEITQ